jgi:hypothetical protein
LRSVTAGFGVAVVALLNSVATAVAVERVAVGGAVELDRLAGDALARRCRGVHCT